MLGGDNGECLLRNLVSEVADVGVFVGAFQRAVDDKSGRIGPSDRVIGQSPVAVGTSLNVGRWTH